MNREETRTLVQVIFSAYPNWKPTDIGFTVDTWAVMLSDYEYSQIAAALKAYITTNTSGFAPSIGQLIGMLDKIGSEKDLNEMEAWALVSKALRNGNYGAEAEFNKLPPAVQKAVGSPELLHSWALSDMASIETVIQSNFMRAYRQILEDQRTGRKITKDIVKAIQRHPEASIEVKA